MPVPIARTTSGNKCPRGPVSTDRSRCSSSSNRYRTRLLFSGSNETSPQGFLSVTPYLIASEKIRESICNSRLMVEGFRVLPFSSSDSRRSFLYFSINSGEICANVLPLRLLLSQIIGSLYFSLFSKDRLISLAQGLRSEEHTSELQS